MFSWKYWSIWQHLCQDTAHWPDIYWFCIALKINKSKFQLTKKKARELLKIYMDYNEIMNSLICYDNLMTNVDKSSIIHCCHKRCIYSITISVQMFLLSNISNNWCILMKLCTNKNNITLEGTPHLHSLISYHW